MFHKESNKFDKREKWVLAIAIIIFLSSVILQLTHTFN